MPVVLSAEVGSLDSPVILMGAAEGIPTAGMALTETAEYVEGIPWRRSIDKFVIGDLLTGRNKRNTRYVHVCRDWVTINSSSSADRNHRRCPSGFGKNSSNMSDEGRDFGLSETGLRYKCLGGVDLFPSCRNLRSMLRSPE